jgi:hypothetical protein
MSDLMKKSRVRATFASFCAAILVGCGGVRAPVAADAAEARQALQEALDSWKQGEQPDALTKRPTPIRVADEDWLSGRKLLAYEQAAESATGPRRDITVRLTFGDLNGRPIAKTVVYEIETDPSTSIVRRDGR